MLGAAPAHAAFPGSNGLVSFERKDGVLGVVAALAVVVLFSFGLAWVFTTMGLIMRAPNAVLNAGFMALFPLLFLSNAFVPPETLPSGLKEFVDANPVSQLVTDTRELMNGTASMGEVAIPLAIAAGLTAVFAPAHGAPVSHQGLRRPPNGG